MNYHIKEIMERYYGDTIYAPFITGITLREININSPSLDEIENAISKNENNYVLEKLIKIPYDNLIKIIQYFIITDNLYYLEYCVDNNLIDVIEIKKFWKLAICCSSFKIIDYMLNLDVDINSYDNYAIIIAAKCGDEKLFTYLVNCGANIYVESLLNIFISQGSLDKIQYLEENGMMLNFDKNNIILAACIPNSNIMNYIIDSGHNIFFDNNKPFRAALLSGNIDTVKLLLSAGADMNDITLEDLNQIIRKKFTELVPILIDIGYNFTLDHFELNDNQKKFLNLLTQ
ncbi:putative ankyrin repeat protein [Powai lake megavirus]|uniref:Putative ankyrin repeat protein n=1 Tax=Powai lake megavirus TaxID=1842663 RepID=A0A160ERE8_9VIRU|nr:putative ankyrin repeat protein [Powai lake megavirus]ANB51148.1 putative ankyrin repeat protein [Powai lake megavirus]